MTLRKRILPSLRTERLVARLLEPREANLMVKFRQENREHLELWEPLRKPAFFTVSFWELNLRLTLRDFREGKSVSFVILSSSGEEVLGVCNYTNLVRGTFQSCHLGYALAKKHEGKSKGSIKEELEPRMVQQLPERTVGEVPNHWAALENYLKLLE